MWKNITKTPGVMGGEACIKDTRIPISLLVEYKQSGLTDSELLEAYPNLTQDDLQNAWDYYEASSKES